MKKIILGLVFILSFISVKSQITTAQMLQNINDTVYQNTAHAITGTKLNKLLRTLVTYINGQSSGNIDTLSLVHKSYSITETITGNKTFSGNTVLSGNVTLTPTINSSLAGANQRIPSHTTANIVFTNASLTSIASANNGGVSGGHTLSISNETGASITIVNNYASAAAGEKIYTGLGGDVTLPNHGTLWLQYNATVSAWTSISSGYIPLATGVTGVLPVANGGASGLSRQLMRNTDTTYATGKTEVYTTITLTAPRVLNLPAASAFAAGTELIFVDEIGGVTGTNYVTITRAGSDLIDGATTYIANITYGIVRLITDGSSKWTANTQTSYSTGTWSPTFTGFSTDPSSITARYILIGKLCFVHMYPASTGTSNSTSFTVTLPFAAANTSINYSLQQVLSGGTQQTGRVQLTANSNVGTLQLVSGAAFSASGNKNCFLMMTYEIQ